MKWPHKTRIAPTPSGFLHLGNVLNFLWVQKVATEASAKILLRIDDLDAARVRQPYIDDVFETLHWLGIQPQEGPENQTEFQEKWSQPLRMPLYKQALELLAEKQAVFACTCSRQQRAVCRCARTSLPLDTINASWKLHPAPDASVVMNMYQGQPLPFLLPQAAQQTMVRKRDGMPSYQLASVVDDVHFGITHIVRGSDLWGSSLAQLHLAQCLDYSGFGQIAFLHHSLLTHPTTGAKLSKTAGAEAVFHLREKGVPAEEIKRKLRGLLA